MKGLLLTIVVIGINGKGCERSACNRPHTLANWAIRNYWRRCVKSTIRSNWTLHNVDNVVCNCRGKK